MRIFLLVVALCASSCSGHKSELDETLEWMDNTYNRHEDISGSYGHGRRAWYTHDGVGSAREVMVVGKEEWFSHRGCDFIIQTDDDRRARTAQEAFSQATWKFNLRDIDPSSAKLQTTSHLGGFVCERYSDAEREAQGMNCDSAEAVFSTRSAAGLVSEDWIVTYPKLTGKDHEARSTRKTNAVYLEFDDIEYAKRFVKAFTHAVELCGGKASPF
jgi:hypothetical protein